MTVAVLINPVSGFNARPDTGRRRAELALQVLGAAGVVPEVLLSERPGHLYELARGAVHRGATRVLAWGGDGTINEVARALAFTSAPLGIIPAGSGNGLARALAIPAKPAAALRHAISATPRTIDLGEIDGHLFANVAGVGFDAHIAHVFARSAVRRGLQAYVRLVARELFTYAPRRYRLQLDDVTSERHAVLLTIANGPQWGNNARIAPGARLDDGLLDVVVAESASMLRVALHVPRLFTGTIDRAPGVESARVRRVEIEADEPLCLHVDGEPVAVTAGRVTARIHPGALIVCA